MKTQLSIYFIALCLVFSCSTKEEGFNSKTATDANGYTYEYVTNDPLNARIYTLDNGLKVFLTQYQEAPRIQTLIGVNAGGASDPADATGLAHYLEHIMFKGTTRFGTLDWEKEKPLLDSIEQMFEHYRTLTDKDERKNWYKKIDELSQEAAKYAIPNEYDKLVNLIGAKGTNAYTTNDRTVYVNDIPANELERWLKIEQHRFREIIPRLFHTELEAVYEEKNRSLDSDYSKVYEKVNSMLFEQHPYGTQTVIGTVEHLKNPSITEIVNYFNKYYVPNNSVISLSGDLDYEESIKLIDKYFGDWESKELEPIKVAEEQPITAVKSAEVYGPDKEWVSMAWRLPAANTDEALLAYVVDMMLNNAQAGLIDLNLVQKQKILGGGSYVSTNKDYSYFQMQANPRQGQTLDEAKDLLFSQLDSLKEGKYDDWLIDAVVANLKLNAMRSYESNYARASSYIVAQNQEKSWLDYVKRFDKMAEFTKEDVSNFVDKWYKDNNYVVVYKKTGDDESIEKVDKPEITRVQVNRDTSSAFYTELAAINPPRLKPLFLDYDKDIAKAKLNGNIPVYMTENKSNSLFNLYYLIDIGKNIDPKLSLAVEYLEYLGTNELAAEDFKKEMFKLGCSFNVFASGEISYIMLSGLEDNFNDAVKLFEDLLANPKANEEALANMVDDILKKREDSKKDRFAIFYSAMGSYADYGPNNPFTNILSADELKALKGEDLVELIKGLPKYEHRVLYYGQQKTEELLSNLSKHRKLEAQLKPVPTESPYQKVDTDKNEVFWVDYDMVQAEIRFINKNTPFDTAIEPKVRMYNEYFGGGMGSIVFQEMRESRALAYAVNAYFGTPYRKDENFTLSAYIGTQVDKLPEAMSGMLELIDDMPASEKAFNNAKDGLLSKIESERITKASILFNYESAKRLGRSEDARKAVYEFAKNAKLSDIQDFQQEYVKNQKYRIMVIGDKDKLNFEALRKYGSVKELSLEEIFGY